MVLFIFSGFKSLENCKEITKYLLLPLVSQSPSYFATMYRKDGLTGGHVIKLGPNNDASAEEALAAWPGGLQIGGGITVNNAKDWISKGASKVREHFTCLQFWYVSRWLAKFI